MEKKKIRYKIVEEYLDLNFPRKDTRYQYRSHLNKFFRFLDVDANTYFEESKTIKDYENDVKRYILEQDGKDVFEYSIFGDPTGQTKIGDFTR